MDVAAVRSKPVVYSLSAVAPNWCGSFVLGYCFVMCFFVSFLV